MDLIRNFWKFSVFNLPLPIINILKGLLITIIIITFLGEVPIFEKILLKKYLATLYTFIIYSLILLFISIIITTIILNKLLKEIYKDELTGLGNSKALKVYLNKKISDYTFNKLPLSIILIDIDDFKKLNSDLGMNKANIYLNKISEILNNDRRLTDKVFRYNYRGDEFLIVTTDTTIHQAIQAAERKRNTIANDFFLKEYNVTISCGIAEFRIEDTYESFTDRVNIALNNAKKKGKNRSEYIN
ncbi:GGDEF domain-containing protein [Chryseobacterium lactis]|uniref:GGDEF domain-containing protein n=1 Tax=Chryseobacterium lactis TaxID=1241981 RepID=UPI001626095B|nr:GGDEF domain-containing protein [Chryseobacterium lactis]